MIEFARLPISERNVFLQETANRRNLSRLIVEKDFWVCFMLRVLFTLPGYEDRFVFKGGTSLSKVYGIIKRFSEDIDISVDPDLLGFGGDYSPDKATSKTKRLKIFKEMEKACITLVKEQLTADLKAELQKFLNKTGGWDLQYDLDKRTKSPVMLFSYPTDELDVGGYNPPRVKIEMGSLTDQRPMGTNQVKPWVAEEFPNEFAVPSCDIVALDIERTFWEKATILHSEYHRPVDKPMRERLSRDYYDVVSMAATDHGRRALKNLELLQRVVEFKENYFSLSWTNYGKAVPGSFHLVPPETRVDDLRRDYRAMEEMFYGNYPTFDEILTDLKRIENDLNSGGK